MQRPVLQWYTKIVNPEKDFFLNITLIEPTGYRRKKAGLGVSVPMFPHIGLAYIASVLKTYATIRVIDVPQASIKEIATTLSDPSDYTLCTVTSYNYLDSCALAHDFALSEKSRLVIGGPHVSIVKEAVFRDGPWHAAVAGEAELILKELIELYPNFDKPIPGLLLPENTMYRNAERISDLDSLPCPDYSAFPMRLYPYHVLLTSRGCPFTCSFCAAPVINGTQWFFRSIDSVIEEMNSISSNYGNKPFHINDDNFTLKRERVIEFCERLISQKKSYRWVAQGVRADKIDFAQLRLMHRAGCERISLGVESASPEVLSAIGKRESIGQIRKAIALARNAGMDVLSMFVIGTHQDTLERTRMSFDFVRKNSLYPVDFYQLIPYPGTVEWEKAAENGRLLTDDYREFDHYSSEPVFETDAFTADERRTAQIEAVALVKEMERKWFWKKHCRFFYPHLLMYRSLSEIYNEVQFLLKRFSFALVTRLKGRSKDTAPY